ncbi:MAG: DUF1513 domain-containing protein [Parvibaculaceae bacterium]|nr:DUF1513 domain-containing protein [Parvibaculaceae bacterium]
MTRYTPHSRRSFLQGSFALGSLALTSSTSWAKDRLESKTQFVSGFGAKHKQYGAAIWSPGADAKTLIPTQGVRLHKAVQSPDGETILAVARRPGTLGFAYNQKTSKQSQFKSAAQRHFFGHAHFSQTGTQVFTTENGYDAEEGRIGVRNVAEAYAQIADWSSYGIGPHDLVMSKGGSEIVVANGGILTHPDQPRAKLNIETMDPSLSVIDTTSGRLLHQARLPQHLHQLSIRHLARAGDIVLFCCQDQIRRFETVSLLGKMTNRGELVLFDAPGDMWRRMQGYVGSVETDPSETYVVATSPRGGLALFWTIEGGHYVGSVHAPDVCGAAKGDHAGELVLSTGAGDMLTVSLTSGKPSLVACQTTSLRWDNHLTRLSI